MTLEEY